MAGQIELRLAADEPDRDCALCPRLAEYRARNRSDYPGWFNAPVPTFGPVSAQLLIVGLAPGVRGANRTGRPFTGDYAGDLLYKTLISFGLAAGRYDARPDDGLTLRNCRITNAVRCVPPQNKPEGKEISRCRPFLAATIHSMPNLVAILALGRIAHESTTSALGLRRSAMPFAHGAAHDAGTGLTLFGSYHCSRYNTNTGRLTESMFVDVFRAIADHLGRSGG